MFGRRSRFAKLELPFRSSSPSGPASLLSRLRNGKRFWFWPVRIIGILGVLLALYFLLFHHSNLRIVRHSPDSQNLALSGYAEKHTKPPAKQHSLESHIDHLRDVQEWQPPQGMKVIGLVFYGRRRFVSILNCYLKRNLVENGGIIEEYLFIVKTDNKEDLKYLEDLLALEPKYKAQYSPTEGFDGHDYSHMWESVKKGNIYVKIDDDVLFIEDSTIRSIVKRKVEHPEYVIVSANLIVQYAFTWIHYHLGAIQPYLPEQSTIDKKHPTISWRKSKLPYWDGPDNFTIEDFKPPPGGHHRWLPLAPGTGNNERTPIPKVRYGDGASHEDWMVAAQQHMSFLQNLEKDELWRYDFEMWDVIHDRLSINLMAISGDDVIAMGPMPKDDEEMITVTYSKKTGKHVVVDGHGVAAHYAYFPMGDLETTDILDRYRAYAEENICTNKKNNP